MSNINYVKYDPNTGKIKHSGSCPERAIDLQVTAGLITLVGDGSYKTDYVDLDTLEIKPKTIFTLIVNKLIVTADGVDNIVSTNVPAGTKLIFDGERYIIDDGIMDITLDVIGIYELRLIYPQHITEVFDIEGI